MEQVKKDHYFLFFQTPSCVQSYLWHEFLQGNRSSLWHELRTKDAHKEVIDVSLRMCISWVEDWLVQVVEWVKGFWEAKKFPTLGFSNAQFDKWLHKATFWHQVSILIQFFFGYSLFFLIVLILIFIPSLMQLEVEAFKHYDSMVSDLELTIRGVPRVVSLTYYI